MSRALTTKNVYDYSPVRFLFTGIWRDVLGAPEMRGVWLVWGKDKNGKSWGTLLLVNYLSTLVRVLYISAEQGISGSFQDALKRASIDPQNKNINWLPFITILELRKRLKGRSKPSVVVIDNLSFYSDELDKAELMKLINDFPHITFILLAHEDKGKPYTAVAGFAQKIAEIIIHVKGLLLIVGGRCPGGNVLIDEEKATLYHGQSLNTKSA
jgi:hypothetical protein